MTELELNLARALNPIGGDADLRERQRGIDYLLANPAEAYPPLFRDLDHNPEALDAPAVIDLLSRFGRPESIPLLQKILALGNEYSARPAGLALGRMPQKEAALALTDALSSPNSETVIAAARGLLARGEHSACAPLRKAMRHPLDTVRYHVVDALAKLNCLDAADRKDLEKDPAPEIRKLIGKFPA